MAGELMALPWECIRFIIAFACPVDGWHCDLGCRCFGAECLRNLIGYDSDLRLRHITGDEGFIMERLETSWPHQTNPRKFYTPHPMMLFPGGSWISTISRLPGDFADDRAEYVHLCLNDAVQEWGAILHGGNDGDDDEITWVPLQDDYVGNWFIPTMSTHIRTRDWSYICHFVTAAPSLCRMWATYFARYKENGMMLI